jgi:hypothetical protein
VSRRGPWELVYALAAIVAVTALYALAYREASRFPVPSSLVGHGIGIVGFALMLITATAYTIRKRRMDARWGSPEAWLRFHMVTGLVGPYMVLLHTAMHFRGLAGVTMVLTVVVVLSGVVGRYLYTALPRVVQGAGPDALDRLTARYEATATPAAAGGGQAVSVVVRPAEGHPDLIVARRRAVAAWRSFHVPLTWALFAAALIHMLGALYYELGR